MMILLFSTVAVANAATYYVAKAGSDSANGSINTPWLTIQHAASTVVAGDTVIVENGTYAETISISTSGTSSSPIVFQSQNKWGAHITPPDGGGNRINIGGAYVTFKAFDITGTPNEDTTIKCNGAAHCSIVSNRIHDSGVQTSVCNSGAAVQITGDNDAVISNEIYNTGVPRTASFRCNQFHPIYYGNGQNGLIQNNIIFEGWQGYAIHINASGNITGATVSNNTVFNGGDNAHNSGGAFILDCHATCDNNTFTNNIFANMQETGRACIWEIQETGATVGIHNLYSENLEYNCAPNIFFNGNTNAGYTAGPTTDPLFVNYTGDQNGDYHLQAGSPAINAGISLGAPSTDFDGVSRLQWDIGAYELAVSAGAPSPPTGLTATVR